MPVLPFDQLNVGDLVAFQIGTHSGCSAINQHKWGVIKVLHLTTLNPHSAKSANYMAVSVLAGLTDMVPTPWQVRFRKVLIEQRFKGQPYKFHWNKPLLYAAQINAGITLVSARRIGRETILRPAERRALSEIQRNGFALGVTIGHIDHIALSLDHEDRAVHDHANWKAEVDFAQERWRQERQVAEARQQTRLRGLTLATLLAETPLQAWDERPELIPPQITAEVRARTTSTLQDLVAFGPKISRPSARQVLSDFVVWLNEVDMKCGGLFETEEREDLMGLLEELCCAIKQKPLIEELDELRTW